MEIREGSSFQMLPPAPGRCQVYADEHPENLPHNRNSLYYQIWFVATYKRSPTWADAMLHCSDRMREKMIEHLRKRGVSEEEIGGEAVED